MYVMLATAHKVHMGSTKCTHNLVHMYMYTLYMYNVHIRIYMYMYMHA